MFQPYHFIGLDIHKRAVAFCEKRAHGKKVASGTFSTNHPSVLEWAKKRSAPWVGGMEATLFTGHLYEVLQPFAVDLQVGNPLRIKAITAAKHKNDRKDAETLADLLRADLFPRCHMASPLVRELRRILHYRNFLVRQAITMKTKPRACSWKWAHNTTGSASMVSATSTSCWRIWTRCPPPFAIC